MIVAYPDGSAASVSVEEAKRRLRERLDARLVEVVWNGQTKPGASIETALGARPQQVPVDEVFTEAVPDTRRRCRDLLKMFTAEDRREVADAARTEALETVARRYRISKSSVQKMMREFNVRKRHGRSGA